MSVKSNEPYSVFIYYLTAISIKYINYAGIMTLTQKHNKGNLINNDLIIFPSSFYP